MVSYIIITKHKFKTRDYNIAWAAWNLPVPTQKKIEHSIQNIYAKYNCSIQHLNFPCSTLTLISF